MYDLLRQFSSLDKDEDGRIWMWELLSPLGRAGIQPGDARIRAALAGVRTADGRPPGLDTQPVRLDFRQFSEIAQHGDGVVQRALAGDLAVPPAEFADFTRGIERIYGELLDERSGEV